MKNYSKSRERFTKLQKFGKAERSVAQLTIRGSTTSLLRQKYEG